MFNRWLRLRSWAVRYRQPLALHLGLELTF
jgi:hypothetical protein